MISRSISIITLKNTEHPVVIVAPKKNTKNYATDAWFAHFVHEGTVNRQFKGKDRGAINKPIRFMEKAYGSLDNARANLERRIFAELEKTGL
jgi:hypothetical protein